MKKPYKGVSLFTGAGGMDVGFKAAGIDVLWANEIDKDAARTFEENNPNTILRNQDIKEVIHELNDYKGVDVLFGGPPCQGFSVAGKMDPNDERSKLIWEYMKAVEIVRPKAFVMENVKALGKLTKWEDVRTEIVKQAQDLGYSCEYVILNSADFGVPQKRERVFFIGIKDKELTHEMLMERLKEYTEKPKTVRETILELGEIGSEDNPITCSAKITLAQKPVMRKSPYAGMMFNGMGRPINIDDTANTLPASMGGNKTPIIDEVLLRNPDEHDWVVDYHAQLMENPEIAEYKEAPSRLRRISTKEAAAIQSFPKDYIFHGPKTSVYKQIGNAVPCKLASAVAKTVLSFIEE
ncbi:DNA cytosine methyltransferase [Alkalibacterium sp. MB6]|uniref:DNA cytosine methyltransferase n=1 Tax=Alkalibacterium sp. MB6 TaxID=2081965 RepID=UPI001F0137F5|nr:DNA (cytosine-5-)-methyltransferase [Alkalibacterium sp. MB6]